MTSVGWDKAFDVNEMPALPTIMTRKIIILIIRTTVERSKVGHKILF